MLNVWHLKVSSFSQFVYFPIFTIFFLNCPDIAEDSIIKKKSSSSNKFPNLQMIQIT